MANKPRPGAVRKSKKGPTTGTGGHGRKALEGKGPTPKAEDRPYHKAYRSKQLSERSAAKQQGGQRGPAARRGKTAGEMVTGRNSVVEALRADVPAKALHVAVRIEMDDRVKESLKIAAERGIPVLESHKTELDRMTDEAVHRAWSCRSRPTNTRTRWSWPRKPWPSSRRGTSTTPRCSWHWTGLPIRATSVPSSAPRPPSAATAWWCPSAGSVGMTASAWKTSAGAAVTRSRGQGQQPDQHAQGLPAGWASSCWAWTGEGDVSLPDLSLATEPGGLVVGSEGKGLSRLVRENCDQIVSIPIDSAMESLNASMAVGISLYEISRQRAR